MITREKVAVLIKERIVLNVLEGRLTVAAAAHLAGVDAKTICRWMVRFLDGGRAALVEGATEDVSADRRHQAQLAALTQALGEAAAEISFMQRSR